MIKFSDRTFQVLTIFFAALGWTIVHTVDRLVDSPTLEYKTGKKLVDEKTKTWEVTYTITNLSPRTTFRETTFMLRPDPSKSDVRFIADNEDGSQAKLRAYSPSLVSPSSIEVNSEAARFVIKVLGPGHKFDLIARYQGAGDVVVLGRPAASGEDSFSLIGASFPTLVVKHELMLLWGCVIAWALGFGYFLYSKRNEPPPPAK